MRNLRKNNKAVVETIAMGMVILVLSIIVVAVFYPITSSINTDGLDDDIQENIYGQNATERASSTITPAENSTNSILDTAGTVFELNPLVALVAIASAIIVLVMGMVYIKGNKGGAL